MSDPWETTSTGIDGPARNAAAVTPNDSTDMPNVARGLFVGGAGNIALTMQGGQELTFTGVTAGAILPICVKRVKSTNTTASNIVALW